MDIKAELEKLLDECPLCADDLEDIISRLPPDAMLVRDVGGWPDSLTGQWADHSYRIGWRDCRRAFLDSNRALNQAATSKGYEKLNGK